MDSSVRGQDARAFPVMILSLASLVKASSRSAISDTTFISRSSLHCGGIERCLTRWRQVKGVPASSRCCSLGRVTTGRPSTSADSLTLISRSGGLASRKLSCSSSGRRASRLTVSCAHFALESQLWPVIYNDVNDAGNAPLDQYQ